jgi:hypothetical protein
MESNTFYDPFNGFAIHNEPYGVQKAITKMYENTIYSLRGIDRPDDPERSKILVSRLHLWTHLLSCPIDNFKYTDELKYWLKKHPVPDYNRNIKSALSNDELIKTIGNTISTCSTKWSGLSSENRLDAMDKKLEWRLLRGVSNQTKLYASMILKAEITRRYTILKF